MKEKKKTIINIQADESGTWCDTCGTAMELFTGYLALTENLIEGYLGEGKEGKILSTLGKIMETPSYGYKIN